MEEKKGKEKIWTRSFSTLVGANTVYFFGFYMLTPTLPLYVVHLGGTSAEVGAVSTAFSVASILMRMVSGYLLPRLGRKRMLLLGVLLSALVTGTYAVLPSITGVVLLRVFQGLGFGIVSTVCATLAADILPDARRGEGISYFGMGTTIAIAFSPTVGLWCMDHYGFNPMFMTAAVSMLFAFGGVNFLRLGEQDAVPGGALVERISLKTSLFEPRIKFQCALLVLFGVCRGAETNFLSLLAAEYTIVGLSAYYMVQTGVSFVLKFVTGKLYDRYGHKATIIPGAIAALLSMLLLSVTRTTPMLMVAGVCSGLAVGALIPTIQVWTVNSVPPERRSVASATYYNFYDLGMGGGAIVLGNLAAVTGYSLMYRWASVCMVVFLALYLGYLARRGLWSRT